MNDTIFFSGTSNPVLAAFVAQDLGLVTGKIEITRFIDNECRVYVKEDVRGKNVFILQSLSQIADQHLVELCLIGQAVKDLGASSATAVIPWMGYSKQDKAFRSGEAVSAQLVAKFIEAAGFDRVITIELHSEKLTPFFTIGVTELSTHNLLASSLRKEIEIESAVVVSPDKGGQSRSERFANKLGLSVVYLRKVRDLTTGRIRIADASESVEGKRVIIFDDIINTGETAIRSSEYLASIGAKNIHFLATHAVLAGEAGTLLQRSPIDMIIVTDTIQLPKDKTFPKLRVVTVAPFLAEEIRRSI